MVWGGSGREKGFHDTGTSLGHLSCYPENHPCVYFLGLCSFAYASPGIAEPGQTQLASLSASRVYEEGFLCPLLLQWFGNFAA